MNKKISYCTCLLPGGKQFTHRKDDAVSRVITTILVIALVLVIVVICRFVIPGDNLTSPYINVVGTSQQQTGISPQFSGAEDIFGQGYVLTWNSSTNTDGYISYVTPPVPPSPAQLFFRNNPDTTNISSNGVITTGVIDKLKTYCYSETREAFEAHHSYWQMGIETPVNWVGCLDGCIMKSSDGKYWIGNYGAGQRCIYRADSFSGYTFNQIINYFCKIQLHVDKIYLLMNDTGKFSEPITVGSLYQNKNGELYIYRGSAPTDTFEFTDADWIKAHYAPNE